MIVSVTGLQTHGPNRERWELVIAQTTIEIDFRQAAVRRVQPFLNLK